MFIITSVSKVYDFINDSIHGVEIYDYLRGKETFFGIDSDVYKNLNGIDILKYIRDNIYYEEVDDIFIDIFNAMYDDECFIQINNDSYNWDDVKDSIKDIIDRLGE